jgi:Ca2+-binding RTX toxin-like protein
MHRRTVWGVAVVLVGAGLGVAPAGAAESGVTENRAPVAAADTYTVVEGQTLKVEHPGLLGNDSDPDGDDIYAVYASGPTAGKLTIGDDGSFVYTPAARYHGTDTFTYKATDDHLESAPATVTITVTPGPNAAPKAVPDSYTVAQNGTLTQSAPGMLANDTDADGDPLTAKLGDTPDHGKISMKSTGEFTYTPLTGYHGTDSFTYRANDGDVDSAPATVTITVTAGGTPAPPPAPAPTPTPTAAKDPLSYCRPGATMPAGYKVIRGTSGKNTLRGTSGRDIILAGGGNDTVYGGRGNDIICGGDGADTIRGGDGNDRVSGGAGDDVMYGEAGDDTLFGGAGKDRISGGPGADKATG